MKRLKRKAVLLTVGCADVNAAKTAINLLRYSPEEVVGIYHPVCRGKTSQAVLGVGGKIPFIASLDEVPDANALIIGIAPPGGKLPLEMKIVILEGIRRKMTIISGLHDFLSEDAEISGAAKSHSATLIDLRQNAEREVASRAGLSEACLRIHTVGHDCNVGKMVASLEVARALQKAGHDAKFVATGQTGMLIEGDGCAVDAVISDFLNGAAERLVLNNQHHKILLIEGQGSLNHPRYSAVTVGLLHGCLPDGLILCYEMGRQTIAGMDEIKIPPLAALRGLYETMANVMHPCRVIGIAINGRKFSDAAVTAEQVKIRGEFGLPACDVLRHGPAELMEAVLRLKEELGK